jgi:hypothetical protein
MNLKVLIFALSFIILVVSLLHYIVFEQFEVIEYEKLNSNIVAARNTNKREMVRRGELKNLQDGDEIQAIRALVKLGGEKSVPIGFDGAINLSPDVSKYEEHEMHKTIPVKVDSTKIIKAPLNYGYNKNDIFVPNPFPTIQI